MRTNSDSSPLFDALASFERCLETPIVPGELTDWLENLRSAGKVLQQTLQKERGITHAERYRVIAQQDPEMLPRVERLRTEDKDVASGFDVLLNVISGLCENTTERFANRSAADRLISEIVERGLALVIRARTQEVALSTWFMEAFQRDRGVAD